MESFARDFGEYSESTGQWALPGWLSSVMTATPFIGKAIVGSSSFSIPSSKGVMTDTAVRGAYVLVGLRRNGVVVLPF